MVECVIRAVLLVEDVVPHLGPDIDSRLSFAMSGTMVAPRHQEYRFMQLSSQFVGIFP